jgi:hypothetical protein
MEKPMGSIIYDYCRKNNISISSLAKVLNIDTSGLYRSLLAKDIKVQRVRAISQILNHNFFEDYYPSLKNPGNTPPPLVLENQKLKERLNQLESDLSYFRNFFELMKTKKG